MVRRWLEAGFEVTVWNRDQKKAAALVTDGAVMAATTSEAMAAGDVVVTMLADGPAVEEVIFESGASDSLDPGCVLIDMSSIRPAMAREHAKRLEERGVDYIDAPVSGGTLGAEQGTLAIMCGGEANVVDRYRLVLAPLGKATHVGRHGSGQLTKLCNQVIVATSIGAVAEALLLAQAGGAIPEAVLEALQGGFADSRILREHGQRMVARDWRPGGITRYQLKDLIAADEVATAEGVTLPILDQIKDMFASLQQNDGGDLDHSALLLELERLNGPHRVGKEPDRT
jgi:2-hydroxy-3-oxopropionate reductase